MCKSPEVGRSRAVSRAWGGSLVATAEGCLWGCAARGRPEETWLGVREGSAVLLPRAVAVIGRGPAGERFDSCSHTCSNDSLLVLRLPRREAGRAAKELCILLLLGGGRGREGGLDDGIGG